MRCKVFGGALDTGILVEFTMKRPARGVECKMGPILGHLSTHDRKLGEALLVENNREIKVYHLPSDNPQLRRDTTTDADPGLAVSTLARTPTQQLVKSATRRLSSVLRQWIKRYFDRGSFRHAAQVEHFDARSMVRVRTYCHLKCGTGPLSGSRRVGHVRDS